MGRFLVVLVPLLVIVGSASASTIDLTYTNLMGLPQGTITFGTVDVTSGSLLWTADSFSFGGITYTPVGTNVQCWDTTTTGRTACTADGFGKTLNTFSLSNGSCTPNSVNGNGKFCNPWTDLTADTTGGYVMHAKYTSSNGGSCTGWFGSFAPSGQTGTNGCNLSAVPEPGTALLVVTALPGFVGLIVARRRQFFRPHA
ncbi:MAG TPA: PEP-CTERM sorting domain-containing protein [bacterium]|nr:PEP-CTERM sorting domain-containing protein [bacterium]